MTREQVYKLIDGEREYQDALPPDRCLSNHDATYRNTVGNYLVLMDEYMARAKRAYADNPGDTAALDVIRKVVGLGVRCMEEHETPPRVI